MHINIFRLQLKYYPGYATAKENIARVSANMKSAGIEVN